MDFLNILNGFIVLFPYLAGHVGHCRYFYALVNDILVCVVINALHKCSTYLLTYLLTYL